MISSIVADTHHSTHKTSQERSSAPWLFCRVASCLCAFPLSHVVETMRPMAVDPVAGVPPPMLGLSVIRGVPTPVIDAAWLFGERSAGCGRFVVVRAGERTVALAVGGVAGIRLVEGERAQSLPPLMGDAHAMSALEALDGELAFFVQAARAAPEDILNPMPQRERA